VGEPPPALISRSNLDHNWARRARCDLIEIHAGDGRALPSSVQICSRLIGLVWMPLSSMRSSRET
jgi:hypothetical protein